MKRDLFSSSGELVNLVSTVSATASGGVPLGSTLHLPVPAGAAGGGVLPGSTLHLPVPAGAAGGGVPTGSALHLPVPAGTAGGGVPTGSALHLAVPAGAAGGGVASFHLPISTGAFPSVSTSEPASNILELPLYATMDSSAHGKYYLLKCRNLLGRVGEAKQAARAEQQWLAKAFRPSMSVTIVGIVPLYLSNHAYGFCVIHIQ